MDAPATVSAIFCVAAACVANYQAGASGDLLREDKRALRRFLDCLRDATTEFFVVTRRPVPGPGPPALGMLSVLAAHAAPPPALRPVGPSPPPGLSALVAPAAPSMQWRGAPGLPPLSWQGGAVPAALPAGWRPPPWQPFPGRGPWVPPPGLGVRAAASPMGGLGAGAAAATGAAASPRRYGDRSEGSPEGVEGLSPTSTFLRRARSALATGASETATPSVLHSLQPPTPSPRRSRSRSRTWSTARAWDSES